jgi:DNA-binding PadR family transcriptional regulator
MRGLPSGQEMVILEELLGARRHADPEPEMYGLEMVKRRPKELGRTSIYVVLTRMVAHGFLQARLETDQEQKVRGPKRRLYKVTNYGAKMYDARRAADRAAAQALRGVLKPAGAMD